MTDKDFDHQLRSLLEQERTAIPDDGFTESVLTALLPRRRALRWRREVIIPGITLAGCWLGLIVLPGGEFLHELLARLPHAQLISSLPISWLILVYVLCWTAVASALETRQESNPSDVGKAGP